LDAEDFAAFVVFVDVVVLDLGGFLRVVDFGSKNTTPKGGTETEID